MAVSVSLSTPSLPVMIPFFTFKTVLASSTALMAIMVSCRGAAWFMMETRPLSAASTRPTATAVLMPLSRSCSRSSRIRRASLSLSAWPFQFLPAMVKPLLRPLLVTFGASPVSSTALVIYFFNCPSIQLFLLSPFFMASARERFCSSVSRMVSWISREISVTRLLEAFSIFSCRTFSDQASTDRDASFSAKLTRASETAFWIRSASWAVSTSSRELMVFLSGKEPRFSEPCLFSPVFVLSEGASPSAKAMPQNRQNERINANNFFIGVLLSIF